MQLKYGTYHQRGAYESPGSRNYQTSWKKTDHLLLKSQNNFQCSSTDLEWFFLVKNITKSVKQWTDLNLGMILLQKKDQCTGQRK